MQKNAHIYATLCVCGRLCVQGRRAVLCRPTLEVTNPSNTTSGNNEDELPSVIEAEGLIEEYLAYDCRDMWVCDKWEFIIKHHLFEIFVDVDYLFL